MEGRIAVVEGYQLECDQLHKKIEEQSKRNGDAMKHNTEASLLAAKSMNDFNLTITETFTDLNNSINNLASKVEDQEIRVNAHEPVVKEIIERETAIKYNKKLLITAATIAGSIMTIVGATAWFISHITN